MLKYELLLQTCKKSYDFDVLKRCDASRTRTCALSFIPPPLIFMWTVGAFETTLSYVSFFTVTWLIIEVVKVKNVYPIRIDCFLYQTHITMLLLYFGHPFFYTLFFVRIYSIRISRLRILEKLRIS